MLKMLEQGKHIACMWWYEQRTCWSTSPNSGQCPAGTMRASRESSMWAVHDGGTLSIHAPAALKQPHIQYAFCVCVWAFHCTPEKSFSWKRLHVTQNSTNVHPQLFKITVLLAWKHVSHLRWLWKHTEMDTLPSQKRRWPSAPTDTSVLFFFSKNNICHLHS